MKKCSFIPIVIALLLGTTYSQEKNIVSNETAGLTADKSEIGFRFSYSISTKNFFIITGAVVGLILLISIIYSFCKVPLKKGYNCRCCMRTKYFIKCVIFILFFYIFILYYVFAGFFGLLDGIMPDEQLKEDANYVEKEKKNNAKFVEMHEEENK